MSVSAERFGWRQVAAPGAPVAERTPAAGAPAPARASAPQRAAGVDRLRLGRVAAFVGLGAAIVSLLGSWIPSLWGDEAASVLSATRPIGTLLTMLTHVDAVHGAYYLGLHEWVRLFGSSTFAVRVPSALAIGVCASAVTWLCGRVGGAGRAPSLRFAVLAGTFAAILPRLTYAGEEARGYAFSAAIATVLWVVVVETLRRGMPSRRGWAAYAVVLTIGVYVFLYLALLAVAIAVVVLLDADRRRHVRHFAIATAAAFLAASPLFVLAQLERHQIAFLAHRQVVTPNSVLVKMWFGAWPFALIAWALILLATALWVRELVRRRAVRTVSLEAVALAWLVIPTGILVLSSIVVAGYTPRYGTFAAPAAAILMALGVRRLDGIHFSRRMPHALFAGVAVVAVLAAAAPVWAGQRTPWAKNQSDWNDIAATVQSKARPGDAIVFDESVRPSRRPRLALDTDPAAFAGVTDVLLKTPYTESATWHATTYSIAEAAALGRFADTSRVWLVEYETGAAPDTWGVAELEAMGYRVAQNTDLHRSDVYLLTR
jgi:mannosyltransferase